MKDQKKTNKTDWENKKNKKNVVVVGGGTGTYTVLKGLKEYENLELTAVVAMTDSGGSTGRLRDELGQLPVGDLRSCLVALANEDTAEKLLRDLFLYRFPESDNKSINGSLSGHNFGNLFLSALTDILGSEVDAVKAASEILGITGQVLPVTSDNANLVAEYENGDVLFGESQIDVPPAEHDHKTNVRRLWTQPVAKVLPETATAIKEADIIIIGPGDLYSSLLSNWVIKGMPEALKKSNAKILYITNLFSRYGQTHDLQLSDYLIELNKYMKRFPDYVLINNSEIPAEGIRHYAKENSYPILDDISDLNHKKFPNVNFIHGDLLSEQIIDQDKSDKIKRSLVRHDSHKLAKSIYNLLND